MKNTISHLRAANSANPANDIDFIEFYACESLRIFANPDWTLRLGMTVGARNQLLTLRRPVSNHFPSGRQFFMDFSMKQPLDPNLHPA